METIIGLLFILLPVIFKLIGKKLENAGTATPPDTAGSFDVGSRVQETMDEDEPEPHPQPQVSPQPQVAPAPADEATPSVIDFNDYMRRRSAAKPARNLSLRDSSAFAAHVAESGLKAYVFLKAKDNR